MASRASVGGLHSRSRYVGNKQGNETGRFTRILALVFSGSVLPLYTQVGIKLGGANKCSRGVKSRTPFEEVLYREHLPK
jgi:hypothetical protein